MTTEAYDPVEELRRLILEGSISEDALQAITGIQPEKLRFALDTAKLGMRRFTAEPLALSDEETMRLSTLPGQLAEGMQIGDDERLKAILESLTIECRLTLENLARLTGLGVDDLRSTLRDPRTVASRRSTNSPSRVPTSSMPSIKHADADHRRQIGLQTPCHTRFRLRA